MTDRSLPASPRVEGGKPIRVLVVDDSAFMRYTITQYLGGNPSIQVVGSARDGYEALELIPKLQPDVVTLDVEMPRLDGLSTLRNIMSNFPRPVIMLSSLTQEGTVETIQALTLGAVDFIAKPSQKANIHTVMEEVANKIIRAARAKVWSPAPATPKMTSCGPKTEKPLRPYLKQDKIVFIGTSTGGPRALNTVIPALAGQIQMQAAIVIVQHMPAGFTHSLADRLDSLSAIRVKEAEPGDRLQVGQALLAPGGFHMTFDENNQVALNQNPPVHGVRPAVDVTLTSLVQHFGGALIDVILTGMGNDGTNASLLVHNSGGLVIAEDESTCVVWGMPRSVIEAHAADIVVPLSEIAGVIEQSVIKSTINRQVK